MGETVTTHQAAETLLRVLGGVDHGQRGGLGPRERLDLVEKFTRISRMVDALRAVLIVEADAQNAARIATGAPLNMFLAKTGALSARQAAGEVFGARDLMATPARQAAALSGEIDRGQARGIGRAMGDLPVPLREEQRRAVEAELLSRAASTPADELARQGTDALKTACPGLLDAGAEADHWESRARRASRARALRFLPERDGSVEFNGSLPVLEATWFQNLVGVHAEADRRANPSGRDRHGHARTPQQRDADALVALLREAQAGGTSVRGTGEGGVVDAQPFLEGIAGSAAGVACGGGEPAGPLASTGVEDPAPKPAEWAAPAAGRVAGRERARIVVTITESELRQRCVRAGVLPEGTRIPASQLRRLACEADILPVVLGGASEVLDVGRAARLVTPGIRRALSVRDKGCIFPGCDVADHRCEAHHVVPFGHGGATSLTNLVLLCPYHHALLEPPPPEPGLPPPRAWRVVFDTHGNPRVEEQSRGPLLE